jgi:ABC-2 type transport system permease protein
MVNGNGPRKPGRLRRRNLSWLLLTAAALGLLNYIGSFVYARLDLTTEKRYTLAQPTRELLAGLEDVVYVKVYLHGDFPPGFRRLAQAARELLDEMRVHAGDNLQYEFIDPSASDSEAERNELYRQLAKQGLVPTNLQEAGRGGRSQKIIFPGAVVAYAGREMPVHLLRDRIGASPESMINNSVLNLEYEFSNAFRKLRARRPERIAFLDGHGELAGPHVADFTEALAGAYTVERVTIGQRLDALKGFKALVVARPRTAFDEKDKFVIDQFILRGGRVLWLIDAVLAEMDSLAAADEMLAVAAGLNLDDMLFRYGARINKHLVQDILAAPIPVVTGNIGNKPQQQFLPWYFFPLVIPESQHPMVRHLNAVRFQFAGSIDTVGAPGIRKTVLLTTSPYARTLNSPVRVSLEILREEPAEKDFNRSRLPLAVLLEGRFRSVYANRLPPAIAEDPGIGFREDGEPTRMVVVADGDVIRNDYRPSTDQAYPLGYDRYTGETYGNKNFLLNAVDYLCDDSGLMAVRAKELRLRVLDQARLKAGRAAWQAVTTAGPVLLLLAFGLGKFYLRKRRYAR